VRIREIRGSKLSAREFNIASAEFQTLVDSIQQGDFEPANSMLTDDFQCSGFIPSRVWCYRHQPRYGVDGVFIPVGMPEKVAVEMEAKLKLYVGNLSKSTTQEDLNALFTQAGEVTTAEVIKDRKSGESRGFAFVTMSSQSEADKAVNMFNTYSLSDHALKVSLANPREQRGTAGPIFEP